MDEVRAGNKRSSFPTTTECIDQKQSVPTSIWNRRIADFITNRYVDLHSESFFQCGFPIPLSQWLFKNLISDVSDLLHERNTDLSMFFDVPKLKDNYQKLAKKTAPPSDRSKMSTLWFRIISVALWMQHFKHLQHLHHKNEEPSDLRAVAPAEDET